VLLSLHALLTFTPHCLHLHCARCLPAQHTPCSITVHGPPCTTHTAYLHTALPLPALRTVLTRTAHTLFHHCARSTLHYTHCLPSHFTPFTCTAHGAYPHGTISSPLQCILLSRTCMVFKFSQYFPPPYPRPRGIVLDQRIKISYTSPSTFL
jgi:hypothetical protein